MNAREEAQELLCALTKKRHLQFTRRGNAAIKQALFMAKRQGRTRLLIPNQGGWLTYPQFGEELGYAVEEILTHDGYIEPSMLRGDERTVLLLNSMPAYAFTIPVADIAARCKAQGILFINDVSATIGTPEASYGDIIIGSCNRWKPLPLKQGGFIATDDALEEQEEVPLDYERLALLLTTLPERCTELFSRADRLKHALQDYAIIHPDHKGYNVIVAYTSEEEKEKLINDARIVNPTIEYTECPRYIRVNRKALSFEIKRQFDTM